MTPAEQRGFSYAVMLIEIYAAGVRQSRRSHSSVRAETADEIADALRRALEVRKSKKRAVQRSSPATSTEKER